MLFIPPRFFCAVLVSLASTISVPVSSAEHGPKNAQRNQMIVTPANEFDFLLGDWKVRNRLLGKRLAHSDDWIEFDASDSFHSIPGGLGTEENYRTEHWPKFAAIGLHLFDPTTKKWTLYWADSKNSPGVLQTLASGQFSDGVGVFYGADTFAGKPITVRVIWKRIDANHVRWEQAFSVDDTSSWETNWTMDFTREQSSHKK